jgi:hypothetical protein
MQAQKCSREECEKYYTNTDKWRVSLLAGLIFLLVSAPMLYRLVHNLLKPLGVDVADTTGCPTTTGLLLHTAVFVLIVRLMMR